MQVGQLEPILNKMDSSMPEMSMGIVDSVGYISGHPVSQQFSLSNKQTTLVSDNPLSHGVPPAGMPMGHIEAKGNNNLQSQQFVLPNNQTGQMGSMMSNMEQISSLKRKAPMESTSHNHTPENLSTLQKRMAQTQHRPWLQPMSATNKRVVQLESVPTSPGSLNSPASSKRLSKTDSFSNKSGSQRTPSQKNQPARNQPPSKVSKDLSDSVRSKMREQLEAALSLVTEQENKPSQTGNNCSGESVNGGTPGNQQVAGSVVNAADGVYDATKEFNNSDEKFSVKKVHDGETEIQKISADVGPGDSTPGCDGRDFRPSNELSYVDVPFSDNFFVKDELLQGNGLSWVLDSDLEMVGKMEIQNAEKMDNEELGGDGVEQVYHQSPQDVAFEIEAELFKLFGGVNKKYKEKGRSLLFNLKDRNNPELRERVMAGEISPERLCSMTAEELASEELSQWRMAKAEELAQMVVLPDTEVDVRRLVRKTHKGEFQVEVEQDDILPVDVSGGSSSVTRNRPQSKTVENLELKPDGKKDRVNASGDKSNVEGRNTSYLTIPSHEGTDLMQGLMVDDGLKDVDFLPPIVSLDEFMESLDSEPPFEILPLDSERKTSLSDKVDSEARSESKSSDPPSKDIADASSERVDDIDKTHTKKDADVKPDDGRLDSKPNDGSADVKSRESLVVDAKSSESPLKTESPSQAQRGTPKGQHVWGGSLQLNISSTANVIGFFKSGEKTSTSEWPGFIETKGRVRLEAFEKFLQQLPLSRSRAVMVVHFVLKEGSPENEQAALQEVSESYVVDERVGFAEPATGFELYFCPPHNKTLELLGKVIQKEYVEALNTIDNGLIGVIVWRKLSSTSPKSSSHHKHTSKKHHLTSRRHQDSTLNSDFAPKSALRSGPPPPANSRPSPDDDDEDDVPPGFGPPASRDEDDLPEFNFSGGPHPPMSRFSSQKHSRGPGMAMLRAPGQTSRPVDQVRELIHKYGQSNAPALGGGASVHNWNDDDDDDIPEWQPQAPTQQVHNFQQQQMLRPHYVNQPHIGLVSQPLPMQTPINAPNGSENPALWQQQQGTWWVPSAQATNVPPSNISCHPDGGHYYGSSGRAAAGQPGVAWQQNVPKSRGF